jgi:hypothetical protein
MGEIDLRQCPGNLGARMRNQRLRQLKELLPGRAQEMERPPGRVQQGVTGLWP